MDHNIPVDMAFALDDVTRAAYSIIFSEINGAAFNWSRMAWEEQK